MNSKRLATFLQIRPDETRRVALQILLTLVISMGAAIGSPGIAALFFARFGVEYLPYMYVALGLVTFLTSMALTALLGQIPKKRLYIGLPLALAGFLAVARVLVGLDLNWFYPVLWLAMYLMWTLQTLLTWGMAGTIFNTRQAKRLFPLFAAGGILGIALGGLATRPLVQLLRAENLLLVWAAALAFVFGLVTLLAREMPQTYSPPWRKLPRVSEDLRKGYHSVRQSPLLRWISLASVLYALLFFSLVFAFSTAATAEFPDEDALAGFLGLFQGASMGVAFLTSLLVANRVYARVGLMGGILILALLYFLGFGALAIAPIFPVLLAYRFLQNVWGQGVSGTAYQAMFNIVPSDRREQTRAFISGVPEQLGIILAGSLLALAQQVLQPQHTYLIGVGAATVAIFSMWQARRAYQGALVAALRAGQSLVFSAEREPFGGFLRDASTMETAAAGLSDADPAIRRMSAEILGDLAAPESVEPLVELLADEEPAVRTAALHSLAQAGASEAILEIASSLKDSEADVRLQAVETLHELARFPRGLHSHITPLLADPDPAVQARVAGTLLAAAPHEQAEAILLAMARQPESEIRILGLQALAESGSPAAYAPAAEALQDGLPSVRYAAAQAIQQADPERCLEPLIRALADEDGHVRQGVAEAIGRIGQEALPLTLEALADPCLEDGALLALEHLPVATAADSIRSYAQSRIDSALRYTYLWWGINASDDTTLSGRPEAVDMLQVSLRDKAERHAHFTLRAVGLLADREAIALARENLADPNQLANALEILDSVKERDLIRPLLKLWESAEGDTPLPEDWQLELLDDQDAWIRAWTLPVAADPGNARLQAKLTTIAETDPDEFVRDTLRQLAQGEDQSQAEGAQIMDTLATMSMMERILSLRRVPLFQELSPAELKQVASIAAEHAFLDGDLIARQDEPGDEMYIIVSGEVQVLEESDQGSVSIAVRQPGDSVGEMAVISREPRMASLVAKGDVRLLCIEQKRFESILRQRPEIGLAVMRVLIARLKEAQLVPQV